MHAHRHKTWGEAAGLPETSARLDTLPAGLDFPDAFPEPIRYDPARKRLVYRGFMSSVSYRFLHELSAETAYLNALDDIFQDSSYALRRPKQRPHLWPWLVGAAGLAGAVGASWSLWH
jgi:hypothetical protein